MGAIVLGCHNVGLAAISGAGWSPHSYSENCVGNSCSNYFCNSLYCDMVSCRSLRCGSYSFDEIILNSSSPKVRGVRKF